MTTGDMFFINGSRAEVRAYQTGFLAGVNEGVLLGREELVTEQLEAQRRYAQVHRFDQSMDSAVVGMRVRENRARAMGVAA